MNERDLKPQVRAALDELRSVIRERYPEAQFEVARGHDEPENIHLVTTVDVDDPDEVVDLVIDRLLELQVEERIPVYVIPLHTPERVLAEMTLRVAKGRGRSNRSLALLGPDGTPRSTGGQYAAEDHQ